MNNTLTGLENLIISFIKTQSSPVARPLVITLTN